MFNNSKPNDATEATKSSEDLMWSHPQNDSMFEENRNYINEKNIYPPNYKSKNKKSFFSPINSFFRTVGILTVLLVLIVGAGFAYILLKPEAEVSKWLVNNTILKNYLTITDTSQGSNVTVKQEETKNVSGFLGLNSNSDNTVFQFTKPENAKTTIDVVQQVLPSVLSLSVREESSRLGVSNLVSGTGFIVSEDGLVVTNKHVIASKCGADSEGIKISGLSHNQKAYELDLVGVDPIDDIAILKIKNPTEKFSPVKFAEVNNVPIGSEVIAIGNVLGQLQNTVTKGIVSGLNRTVDTGNSDAIEDECTSSKVSFIDNLIQTDAAINRGNSGGPLFDSAGLLIGMNTLGTTDSQNIGFALSSTLIVSDLNNYIKTGKIVRPRLGIYSRPITPLQKQENTWLPTDYGEILLNPSVSESAVSKDSPADKAGMQPGDVILQFNGEKLQATDQNPSPLRRMILSRQPDEEVELVVRKAVSGDSVNGYKYDSQDKTIKVKLGSISFDLNKSKGL